LSKIPVVDESDKILCHKSRSNIEFEDIYRVSALWINDSEGNALLAKRALTKKNNPGKWGPAVAGTVEKGETYKINMIKEAEEELGLKNIAIVKGPKTRTSGKHNHFTQWFKAVLNKPLEYFVIRKEEVAEIKWFTKEECFELVETNPELFLSKIKTYFEMFE